MLTPNARVVLERRYLLKDAQGVVVESPEELFTRVARAVSLPDGRERRKWEKVYFDLMSSLRFLPNSPTLMNAGKPEGQLSACYVLPIEDSLDGIFDTLKDAARIHQSGGGTGFSFSRLRHAGSWVQSSAGVASGPVSFMRIYDVATDTIKQGGTRRGANMAILRVDHPDIFEFIESKRDLKSITNFNISVGITDAFMLALEAGDQISLRDPATHEVLRAVPAREVFDKLIQAAWETGDPGVVFLDRMNRFNPTPKLGEYESTNPCGEQPLLPYESCNLGSLNLGLYVQGQGATAKLDWDQLRTDIHVATRFLDNVIDVNVYPVQACAKITRKNRKIGLGVMGFADLLLLLGLPYDSEAARELGEKVMSFLDREAKHASAAIARRRGEFPAWKGSLWQKLGYPKLRNATVSTVAPTGTISIIAGCSSGIEPIFSAIFDRNVLSGQRLREIHPAVERALRQQGRELSQVREQDLARIIGPAWRPAQAIAVQDHVKMQAVFQRHSDSAVSKTINLPSKATISDVAEAYRLAYQCGCKGITIYRDQSRPEQVLEAINCDTCVD